MTVKVYSVMWDSFDAQMARLPVSRDRFLSLVLRNEIPRLAEGMAGKKLTSQARGWISSQLARLGTKTVNIGVDDDVVDALKEVTESSNMVRDAFFNRMITFLRSSDTLLDRYGLPKRQDGRALRNYGGAIATPVSPISALEEIFSDPLWYLHEAVQEICETNLYLLDFPSPKLDGFACWLDNVMVPGTRSNRKHQRDLDDLFNSLENFELEAFSSAKGK